MSDREAFEARMRDTFGDAVSLHNDGVMYTDGFVAAVHIGWLKGSLAEAERFKRELEMQAAQAPQPVVDRNDLIELLIATRTQSEGVTADLIIKLLKAGKGEL